MGSGSGVGKSLEVGMGVGSGLGSKNLLCVTSGGKFFDFGGTSGMDFFFLNILPSLQNHTFSVVVSDLVIDRKTK
jgi:hypothetical protein